MKTVLAFSNSSYSIGNAKLYPMMKPISPFKMKSTSSNKKNSSYSNKITLRKNNMRSY